MKIDRRYYNLDFDQKQFTFKTNWQNGIFFFFLSSTSKVSSAF